MSGAPPPPPPLPDDALPGLFQAADQASLHGQKRYITSTALRLALIVLAAVTAALSLRVGAAKVDVMALVTAVAFVGTALVEVYLLADRPSQTWYDGRALAESAKTLAWRYAVGGAPYTRTGDAEEEQAAGQRFRRELESLLIDAPETGIEATTAPAISPRLRELRAAAFEERKQAYLTGRILDQQRWYSSKATLNRSRAHSWRIALLAMELLGVVAALLRAFGVLAIDLPGIAAAVVGAGAAWLAVKQHDSLARAYAFAANELAIARSRLEDATDEPRWAAEVADAEEAVSREHTMWRASRTAFRRRPS
ncbi:DUF4231 domain-containing protein [Sphaerisporangium sp. TRM90804]|uniref:DUF4231 domain-containing protein n=1 Tax=Sphaerisporangium sp. TRM90804 TaxID=3031113 RepID=UPI002448D488|nr:DUF4231 domain-containing protein [Sphaerisporangium sp. TRM90804]MDH2429001.1 DUF4231 domain-containing protein [Sphaerisporangium sp. TRM90804]